jgi:solute carrier family 41
MNMSARLSTSANTGELDKPSSRNEIIKGNLGLLQVQAGVVSAVAAGVSVLLGVVLPRSADSEGATMNALRRANSGNLKRPKLHNQRISGLSEFIVVTTSSMATASLASLLLGSFMCFLVVLCRKMGRDPDNIAPPIAAMLGDLTTLLLLGVIASVLVRLSSTPVPFILLLCLIASSVWCFFLTQRNHLVSPLLKEGWSPLMGAMAISTASGIVLDLFVEKYKGFALLAVLISGLPGSVGSIFVSRLSTALHSAALDTSTLPTFSLSDVACRRLGPGTPTPFLVALALLLVTLPIQLIILLLLSWFQWLPPIFPFLFYAFAVLFFSLAVGVSLVIAKALTEWLWKKGKDPDVYALPVHSALMDLVGQLLLVGCFEVVAGLGYDLS